MDGVDVGMMTNELVKNSAPIEPIKKIEKPAKIMSWN